MPAGRPAQLPQTRLCSASRSRRGSPTFTTSPAACGSRAGCAFKGCAPPPPPPPARPTALPLADASTWPRGLAVCQCAASRAAHGVLLHAGGAHAPRLLPERRAAQEQPAGAGACWAGWGRAEPVAGHVVVVVCVCVTRTTRERGPLPARARALPAPPPTRPFSTSPSRPCACGVGWGGGVGGWGGRWRGQLSAARRCGFRRR